MGVLDLPIRSCIWGPRAVPSEILVCWSASGTVRPGEDVWGTAGFSKRVLCLADPSAAPGMRSKRPESMREQENKRIVAEIKEIHRLSRETYGSLRIHADKAGRIIYVGQRFCGSQVEFTWFKKRAGSIRLRPQAGMGGFRIYRHQKSPAPRAGADRAQKPRTHQTTKATQPAPIKSESSRACHRRHEEVLYSPAREQNPLKKQNQWRSRNVCQPLEFQTGLLPVNCLHSKSTDKISLIQWEKNLKNF